MERMCCDKFFHAEYILQSLYDQGIELPKICVKEEPPLSLLIRNIKLSDSAVFVQASTLVTLELLLEFLKESNIPVSGFQLFKRQIFINSII
jgi:hypothetical protein